MRLKTTPPPIDLINSKRGIIFSFNLFQKSNSSSSSVTSCSPPPPPPPRDSLGESIGRQLGESIGDAAGDALGEPVAHNHNHNHLNHALCSSEQDEHENDDQMSIDDDSNIIDRATLHSKNLIKNKMDSNIFSSPTNSISSTSKQSCASEDRKDLETTATDATTSSTRPSSGYDLSVDVHKITSSRLLSRMHRQLQEGKYLNAPVSINPAVWPAPKPDPSGSTHGTAEGQSGGPVHRKRKITNSAAQAGECTWCRTRKTAQWRKGPTGARGLCNRCGIEWAKQIRFEAKRTGLANPEAEAQLVDTYRDSARFKRFAREHLAWSE